MSPYRLPSGEVLIPAVASDGGSLSGDGMIKCWPTDPRVWEFERYYALFGEKIPDYPGSASFAAPTATLTITGDPEVLARFRAEAGLVGLFGEAAFGWEEAKHPREKGGKFTAGDDESTEEPAVNQYATPEEVEDATVWVWPGKVQPPHGIKDAAKLKSLVSRMEEGGGGRAGRSWPLSTATDTRR